ncbi:MAG: sulfatase [Polyangiaceae bacterium]
MRDVRGMLGRVLDLRPMFAAAALALLNSATMIATSKSGSARVRLYAHALDLGYALSAGLLLTGLFAIGHLLATRPRVRAAGALALGFAIGALVLAEDVTNRASKLPGLPLAVWSVLLGGGIATLVPAAGLVASLEPIHRRRALRIAGGLGATLLQLDNHRVLVGLYPGIHLVAYAMSLVTLAVVLPATQHVAARVATGAGALVGLAALVVSPPRGARFELLRHPGSSLTPYVARVHTAIERSSRRSKAAATLPSEPKPHTSPGLGIDAPIVLLLTVDGMRNDIVDDYPSELPNLAALSKSGFRFKRARTMAPATLVSLTSVTTGKFYSSQLWSTGTGRDPEVLWPYADPSPRFPALLTSAGVSTVVVVCGDWMRPDYGVVPGFSEVIDPPREGALTPSSVLADRIIERVRAQGSAPLFVFTHFLDAHAPYDLTPKKGTEKERYVAELGLVDTAIGRIMEAARAPGLAERVVLVVSADHGEAFEEHNHHYHASSLYEEVMRVPLFVHVPPGGPRGPAQGGSTDVDVSLADFGPTILDLFGLDTPGGFEGRSLVPALLGQNLEPRITGADTGRLTQVLVFPDGHKVIYDKRNDVAELYDLTKDPKEEHNLYEEDPLEMPHLDQLFDFFDVRTRRENGYEPPIRLP